MCAPALYKAWSCPHFPLLDTAGLARMAGKIRNPKSETNSNEQRSKSSKPSRRGRADWSGFENLSFEFGACFGFRVSDFGFVLAGQPGRRRFVHLPFSRGIRAAYGIGSMKTVHIISLACVSSLLIALPSIAKDKSRKEHADHKDAAEQADAPEANAAAKPGKEPWVGVKVTIADDERRVIQSYVDDRHANGKPGRKGRGLPPGLAKKTARGGELPPGWEKRCVRGEVMPTEVYARCHPLPPEVVVKLPVPPPGTILVAIDGKVARLAKATREILDVFDVRF